MGENPSGNHNGDCDDCPVEMVSWRDAVEYANNLSQSESLVPCYGSNGASWDRLQWVPTSN